MGWDCKTRAGAQHAELAPLPSGTCAQHSRTTSKQSGVQGAACQLQRDGRGLSSEHLSVRLRSLLASAPRCRCPPFMWLSRSAAAKPIYYLVSTACAGRLARTRGCSSSPDMQLVPPAAHKPRSALALPSLFALTSHVVFLGVDVHLVAILGVVQALHAVHSGNEVNACGGVAHRALLLSCDARRATLQREAGHIAARGGPRCSTLATLVCTPWLALHSEGRGRAVGRAAHSGAQGQAGPCRGTQAQRQGHTYAQRRRCGAVPSGAVPEKVLLCRRCAPLLAEQGGAHICTLMLAGQ